MFEAEFLMGWVCYAYFLTSQVMHKSNFLFYFQTKKQILRQKWLQWKTAAARWRATIRSWPGISTPPADDSSMKFARSEFTTQFTNKFYQSTLSNKVQISPYCYCRFFLLHLALWVSLFAKILKHLFECTFWSRLNRVLAKLFFSGVLSYL